MLIIICLTIWYTVLIAQNKITFVQVLLKCNTEWVLTMFISNGPISFVSQKFVGLAFQIPELQSQWLEILESFSYPI